MSTNKEKESKLMIYTIFLSGETDKNNHLNEIAKIGGTEKVFKEKDFKGLDKTFQNIAEEISFGLKIK